MQSIKKVKKLPLKFQVGECVMYKALLSQETKSDLFKDNGQNGTVRGTVQYNVSFYTTGITENFYQIAVLAQQSQDQDSSQDPYTAMPQIDVPLQNDGTDNSTSIDDLTNSVFEDKQDEIDIEDIPDDEADSDENIERNNIILSQIIKMSICNVNRDGKIDACQFSSRMSFADMNLLTKFLKLYVPDLSIDKYSISGRRILQEDSVSNSQSDDQEATSTAESEEAAISLQSQDKESVESDSMKGNFETQSNHDLDLNEGKIGQVQQSKNVGLQSSGNFNKNETAVNEISQSAQFTMSKLGITIYNETGLKEQLIYQEIFNFTTIYNPETYFSNISLSPQEIPADLQNISDSDRLLFGNHGRYLEDSNFPIIDVVLGQINLLFVSIKGGFAFQQTKSDVCTTGLYVRADPLISFWIFRSSMKADMRKSIATYRYYKLAFQQNIKVMQKLLNDTNDMIDLLVFNNLEAFYSDFKLFIEPINTVEESFKNYTEQKLNQVTSFQRSLDLSQSLQDTIDSYSAVNMQNFLSHMQERIETLFSSYNAEIDTIVSSMTVNGGKKYSALQSQRISTYKESILDSFDKVLDKVDMNIEEFQSKILGQQTFLEQSFSTAQSSITDWYQDLIQNVFTASQSIFMNLSKAITDSYQSYKEKIRVRLHLHHASLRAVIAERFDDIIEQMQENTGEEQLQQNQIQILDRLQSDTYVNQLSMNVYMLKIENSEDNIIEELFFGVYQDISQALQIFIDILLCGEERAFFAQTYNQLQIDLQNINDKMFRNITNSIQNTVNNVSTKFDIIKSDLKSIPDNINSLFSKPVDMNALASNKQFDLANEINDIKVLIQQIDDLVDSFASSIQLDKKFKAYIDKFENEVQTVLQAPDRMKNQFETILNKIKQIGVQLKYQIKAPLDGFSASGFSLLTIKTQAKDILQKQIINYGIGKLQLIAKDFGSSFLDSLMARLDKKIGEILPKSGKKYLLTPRQKSKAVTFFEGYIPLPIGTAFVQIVKSFSAKFSVYFEFADGKLQVVVDPTASFSYSMRLGWSLYVVKFASQLTGTIFEGTALTMAGLRVFSLKPSLFINSAIQFNALVLYYQLVYQYLIVRVGRRCWRIGRRWWRITICIWYLKFDYSPWKVIAEQRQVLGLSWKKTLFEKEETLLSLF